MARTLRIHNIKPLFNPIYCEHLLSNNHPIQIYYGGSSSGKSHAVAQRTILDVLNGRNYLVVRKTGDSIRRSTFNELISKIYDFKLDKYFNINKSDMLITCVLNRKQIILKGLDDVEKLKSIKPLDGVITDIWIEEATESNYDDYKQLDKRLRGVSRFIKRITFSFNPILQEHWIYTNFFLGLWQDGKQYVENDEISILKTTYKDNKFLMPDDIDRLERETDPYYREVYLLGNWGVLAGVIFKNWETRDFDKESFSTYRFGLDWGFDPDPFACIRVALDLRKREIYICDEIYGKGMLNDESIPLVKNLAKGGMVWCDNAEPKSIKEYRSRGINARAVKKGSGSVEEGINFLKRFKIIIHTSCINASNEFRTYRYKEDRKTGDILPEPVDKDNHIIDALRYALESDMLMKGTIKDIL